MTETSQFKSHLGLSFTNAAGELVQCWQLLNSENKAVAIADFRNGKLERFLAAPSCQESAKQWLSELLRLEY